MPNVNCYSRGRMDRDYSEGEENNSGYEAGFSENQAERDNQQQGYSEGRTYAEERGYNAEKQASYRDHQRGNALMLQSNAPAKRLQDSALILALISFVAVLNSIC